MLVICHKLCLLKYYLLYYTQDLIASEQNYALVINGSKEHVKIKQINYKNASTIIVTRNPIRMASSFLSKGN